MSETQGRHKGDCCCLLCDVVAIEIYRLELAVVLERLLQGHRALVANVVVIEVELPQYAVHLDHLCKGRRAKIACQLAKA